MIKSTAPALPVDIGLSAVVVAAGDNGLEVLLSGDGNDLGLPFGSFDPVGHRTFELAVRDFVTAQTGFALGYVEQLYTFGDKGREAPVGDARIVSVGYLALAGVHDGDKKRAGKWANWYQFFPWENHNDSAGLSALRALVPKLLAWAQANEARERVTSAFGIGDAPWQEARVLERYEILYEAGLITEAARDSSLRVTSGPNGAPLVSDHRRILATAITRLRAKIRYRPIIFDLAPPDFTLSALQDLVEQVCGVALHKQNFRRTLEQSGLIEPTGGVLKKTGGRPAKLFTRSAASHSFGALGLSLPLLKQ